MLCPNITAIDDIGTHDIGTQYTLTIIRSFLHGFTRMWLVTCLCTVLESLFCSSDGQLSGRDGFVGSSGRTARWFPPGVDRMTIGGDELERQRKVPTLRSGFYVGQRGSAKAQGGETNMGVIFGAVICWTVDVPKDRGRLACLGNFATLGIQAILNLHGVGWAWTNEMSTF